MAAIAAVGVAVALGPMFISESVIRWVAMEQGRASLESMAATMTEHAENVLDNAAEALAALSRGGVSGCSPESVEFIAEAVFTRLPLKEIGVYDKDGMILCSNFGPAEVALKGEKAVTAAGGAFELSMIPTRIPGHMALGMRRDAESGEGGLAAIIETSAVLMELLHGDMRDDCHARVELAGGTMVAFSGQTRQEIVNLDPQMIEIRRASARYPIVAAVAAPRAALLKPFMRLTSYAKIGGGVVGLALLIFVGATVRARPTLEADIEAAMEGGEFVPYYQPIVDNVDGRVSGCEVLLRWIKRDGEVVPPDVFVPFAEATGQIIPITRLLMQQVARDLDDICAAHPSFRISINLVAEHFGDSRLVGDVRKIFSGPNVTPGRLSFEITERRPLSDIAGARKVIGELQALGCEVALDDAGTGHGGLAYIHQLGMDTIKIDRMFVAAIGLDAAKAPIVDALIELGHDLNMKVVAEGVETEEQFGYLAARGARYFQGYLFARPMPPASFARFVRAFAPTPPAVEASPAQTAMHALRRAVANAA